MDFENLLRRRRRIQVSPVRLSYLTNQDKGSSFPAEAWCFSAPPTALSSRETSEETTAGYGDQPEASGLTPKLLEGGASHTPEPQTATEHEGKRGRCCAWRCLERGQRRKAACEESERAKRAGSRPRCEYVHCDIAFARQTAAGRLPPHQQSRAHDVRASPGRREREGLLFKLLQC
jgi:hypothetical protein